MDEHCRMLVDVARSVVAKHDGAMDAYALVLERLRFDDCRRLRRYAANGTSKFSNWLVVVARRMCLDFSRRRYGRLRAQERHRASAEARRESRRRPADLTAAGVDVMALERSEEVDADESLRTTELLSALRSVLVDLEPSDRLLLKLRFEDGLTRRRVHEAA